MHDPSLSKICAPVTNHPARRGGLAFATFAAFAAFAALTTSACDPGNLPGPDGALAPAVAGEAPVEAPEPDAPAEDPETQTQLDSSRITFVVTKATGEHTGHFAKFDAKARYAKEATDELEALTLQIDVASLKADEPLFAEHVKSATFLNVKKFPTATFTSDGIADGGRKMKGQLTLRGVEVPMVVETRQSILEGRRIAEADFSLSLSRFGITDPLIDAEMVDDTVELQVHLEFPPAPPKTP